MAPSAPRFRPVRRIPTHLITGFLGVGKTTAIRHLLAQRPPKERWAVLVNEFGEVGVDAALLPEGEVAIRQVAGGCLCCVASQGFSVGLNQLIRQECPERILIEPTGLGHPAQIIRMLTEAQYTAVLELRATLTLMDARHLASPRHRTNANWVDQIHLADVLVANKADRYGPADHAALDRFIRELDPPKARVARVEQGRLDPEWLDLPLSAARRALFPEAHAFLTRTAPDRGDTADPAPAPVRPDWWTVDGRGDGYFSRSWLFGPGVRLEAAGLRTLLDHHPWDRVKGVLATDTGWLCINRVAGEGGVEACPPAGEGRLEIIDHQPIAGDDLDRQLRRLRRPE